MIKLIDYNNLNSLVINDGQNVVGENLLKIYNDFGEISSIDDIERFCFYIKNSFIHDSNMTKFERNSEEIAKSNVWSGCSDFGTLVAPILRMNNIPTIYVQTAYIEWIKEYQKNFESLPITGHIFLEVFVDDNWYLLDANNGRLFFNYDIDNSNLPMGFIAFSKSMNGHQVGCNTNENNRIIMEDYFREYDISSYDEPNYDCIKFFDLLRGKKNK